MKGAALTIFAAMLPVTKAAFKAPSIDDLVEAGIAERCEGSFVPEWHKYQGFTVNGVAVANPVQMAMNWVGTINHEPVVLPLINGKTIKCDTGTLMFSGVNALRNGTTGLSPAKISFTRKLTGSFNEDWPVYRSANYIKMFKGCLFTEIKETV
jgi:hypothetical protein